MDLNEIHPNLWTLKSDNITQKFEAKISPNKNQILISSDFKVGKSYNLNIPKQSVSGAFLKNEKTYLFKFEIDKPENYGSLTLKLKNIPNAYFWVQLLDNKGIVKYSQYTNQNEVRFIGLATTTYHARILVDNDGNKFWDEADFAEQKPAEDVYTFEKEISIRKLWEIIEDWTLE